MYLCYKNQRLIPPLQSALGMKGDSEGKEKGATVKKGGSQQWQSIGGRMRKLNTTTIERHY